MQGRKVSPSAISRDLSSLQMTHERVKKKNKQRASEMNLAAVLLCIVFLFLVCHFPRILLNVHEIFMLADMTACGDGKIKIKH